MNEYDFSGWATKNNLKCSDGRVIIKDAFKHNDKQTVPLVWNHNHNEPFNVLGHAYLENREEGVYAKCKFNETESGKDAKMLVEHGDITGLSIYANHLEQNGPNVLHGNIREVSLVLAGANPGALIDSVIIHGEESVDESIIYTGENIEIYHSDNEDKNDKKDKDDGETVEDVFNTLTEKQKNLLYVVAGMLLQHSEDEDVDENNDESSNEENDDENQNEESENNDEKDPKGGEEIMKHNVFEGKDETNKNTISHSDMVAVITDAKRFGSMKESALQHGITNIDYLFPEAKTLTNMPEFISRDTGWVKTVMNGTHHSPFSRIKSLFADITEDDARAKGYIKGKLKKEEVFSLLKRTTTPTTVYKKQKLDRDDMVDIVDFDVVAWLKFEMRGMLDEELARAILVGDGRLQSSDDKINEQNIRPIWKDDSLYTIKKSVPVTEQTTEDEKARGFIKACIKARKDYKGSGNPSLFMPEDILTLCLLLTDTTGRDIYDSIEKLAKKLRVKEIITVPVMEKLTRNESNKSYELAGIIVNLNDYNVGADKGGSVNMFDDFDIDYNAQKYLIETRCSGALTKPYSAIAIEFESTLAG